MSDFAKNALDRQMNRLEALIESLEKLSNPAARVVARELVQTLLALHGAGLERMLEINRQHDGEATVAAWGGDDLVGSLLMLHGLHPVSLETRARNALNELQPLLRCHGGQFELVAVTESLVRVRLLGDCSLSPQELEHTLQEAFAVVAPDVQVIEVENTNAPAQRIALPLVQEIAMNFEPVARIAEALLYEGYLLYPYGATAVKNQHRFTFGCLLPPTFPQPETSAEGSMLQTECLLRGDHRTRLTIQARFLHSTTRISPSAPTWREATPRQVATPSLDLHALAAHPHHCKFAFPSDRQDDGLVVRTQRAIEGAIDVSAQDLGGGVCKLCVRLSNLTPFEPADGRTRADALAWALLSCHLLLGASDGEFLSLLDPPATWRDAAASCRNIGVYPVLAGDPSQRDTMLASPIILYDYPQIAAASPGDLFDGTEMDEMLTLRIQTLTGQEKQEMALLDPRAAQLLARCESLPSEQQLGLHGICNLDDTQCAGGLAHHQPEAQARNGDFLACASGWYGQVNLDGAKYSNLQPGVRVRLKPRGNADAFDLALAGKTAVIVGIEQDFEEQIYVTVAVDDDPGQDLGIAGKPGHRFFFRPDEVEVLVDDHVNSQPNDQETGPRGILIAGIGNIFFGDDAFGVEVVRRLAMQIRSAEVVVKDFGIRGFDLACALQDGYRTVILVDAVGRGSPAGTLHVLDLDAESAEPMRGLDIHLLDPVQVIRLSRQMGGPLPCLRLVGCEPATLEFSEAAIANLSEPVRLAVPRAVELICNLVAELRAQETQVGGTIS